mmetsp:Transcript_37852/g.77212  ORF Transcript_37852/g.77212 Transcript_37852/m.77212 type:complete len:80 (-) Transcript_37852:1020-1259(-)
MNKRNNQGIDKNLSMPGVDSSHSGNPLPWDKGMDCDGAVGLPLHSLVGAEEGGNVLDVSWIGENHRGLIHFGASRWDPG